HGLVATLSLLLQQSSDFAALYRSRQHHNGSPRSRRNNAGKPERAVLPQFARQQIKAPWSGSGESPLCLIRSCSDTPPRSKPRFHRGEASEASIPSGADGCCPAGDEIRG